MQKFLFRLMGFYLNTLAFFSPRTAGKKGFDLFSTPQPAPVKDYHLTFFESSEKFSFDVDGYTIQTYKWGHGPTTILFLHGWQSHSFRWKKYVEAFSKDEFTLYAMDAPAHGLSSGASISLPLYSKAVDMFIDRIQPVQAVVAHSFGGFAILFAIFQKPSLPVSRLVLMGVPGESMDFIKQMQVALGINKKTMKAMLTYFSNKIQHPPEFFSTVRFAKAVMIPTLIIHNNPDTEAPYRYAEAIHEAITGSKLITTENLGHNLKSPQIVETVKEFVSQKQSLLS